MLETQGQRGARGTRYVGQALDRPDFGRLGVDRPDRRAYARIGQRQQPTGRVAALAGEIEAQHLRQHDVAQVVSDQRATG
ncbi:hypothetical protein P4114_15005 [Pseudomonas aeruginosa]|nr:hypothetical protein [Pseudomonas aeruginosa]